MPAGLKLIKTYDLAAFVQTAIYQNAIGVNRFKQQQLEAIQLPIESGGGGRAFDSTQAEHQRLGGRLTGIQLFPVRPG